MKLNSKQLRKSEPSREEIKAIKRNPIYLVLDRIVDTYNIGSLFRLGDAIACEKMYLCGDMEYPPSSRIHKAAVGTEGWVPWEKRDTTLEVVRELKGISHPESVSGSEIPKTFRNDHERVQIIAIEQDSRSIHYSQITNHLQFPIALVVGNETEGIEKEVLNEADVIVELPMFGINKSFNTWGSAAVIAYKVLENL